MLSGEIYLKLFQKFLAETTRVQMEEKLYKNGKFILHVLSQKKNNLN